MLMLFFLILSSRSDLVLDASRFTSLFAHNFFNPSRSWMPVHTAVGILDTRGLIVSVLHFQLYNLITVMT